MAKAVGEAANLEVKNEVNKERRIKKELQNIIFRRIGFRNRQTFTILPLLFRYSLRYSFAGGRLSLMGGKKAA